MDFPLNISWTVVPLLSVGLLLGLLGARVAKRVSDGLASTAVLASCAYGVWEILSIGGAPSPLGGIAVWGTLVYGVCVVLPAVYWLDDGETRGARGGGALIALAGFACLSADAVAVVFVGLHLVTIGLHWCLAAGAEASERVRVVLGLRFHHCCLLMTLLGVVVLYGVSGTLSIRELTTVEVTANLQETASGSSLVAAVALLTGLCGFAMLTLIRSEGDSSFVSTALTAVLVPGAAFVALLRLIPPLLPALNNMVEAAVITAAAIVLAIAVWNTWVATGLTSIIRGLMLLQFSMWLTALAVGAWDSAHTELSLAAVSGLPGGISAAVFGLCVDSLACLGLTGLLSVIRRGERPMQFEEDLAGLLRRKPIAGCAAIVCLGSLCGLPPTPGFWFRWWSLVAAVIPQHSSELTGLYQPHFGFLFSCGLLLAGWLAAIYFSLRLFGAMLLDEPRGRFEIQRTRASVLAVAPVCFAVLALGIRPGPLLRFAMSDEAVHTAKVDAPAKSGHTRDRSRDRN